MVRKPMSPAARAKLSAALKRYYATHHKGKKSVDKPKHTAKPKKIAKPAVHPKKVATNRLVASKTAPKAKTFEAGTGKGIKKAKLKKR
jgi:hypothetical protein